MESASRSVIEIEGPLSGFFFAGCQGKRVTEPVRKGFVRIGGCGGGDSAQDDVQSRFDCHPWRVWCAAQLNISECEKKRECRGKGID